MNRVDVRTRVMEEMEDNDSFISVTNLNDSIQDAYDDLVIGAEMIEKQASIAAVSGRLYYDLATLISDYYSVTGIYSTNMGRWLESTDKPTMVQRKIDWELMTGGAQWFMVVDQKRVAIIPYQPTASDTYIVNYTAVAPTLGDTTSMVVPLENQRVMDHYTLAEMQEQAREFEKAKSNWSEYERHRKLIVNKMSQRASTDRRYELCQFGRIRF